MLAIDAEGNTPRHHAGPPFDAEHQRRLFATLESAPDASLDYLRDLTRSADRLAEFFELFYAHCMYPTAQTRYLIEVANECDVKVWGQVRAILLLLRSIGFFDYYC